MGGLAQDEDWLSTARLSHSVTIAANSATGTFQLTPSWFWEEDDTLDSGNLTATVGTVSGYNTTGTGSSTTVYIHGREELIGKVTLDKESYEFAEDSGGNTINIVVTLEPKVTPTAMANVSPTLSTGSGSATDGDDYRAIRSLQFSVTPSDFTKVGNNYVGRKGFTLTIIDDELPEDDETLTLNLSGASLTGLPLNIFERCKGSSCSGTLAQSFDVKILDDELGAPTGLTATGGRTRST